MAFDEPIYANIPDMSGNASNNLFDYNDEDPAAEFLERERRDLADITGDSDANSFSDPFGSRTNTNGLFSNGSNSPIVNIGGSFSPVPTRNSPYQAFSEYSEQMQEPEKIRRWKEEFAARITKKDAEEDSKRREMQEQARKELDDFYKQRTEQLERSKQQNRLNNRTIEDEIFMKQSGSLTSNGKISDWDKITSLCDFNPKGNRSQKDLTRYRGILLQLKQQQATGK